MDNDCGALVCIGGQFITSKCLLASTVAIKLVTQQLPHKLAADFRVSS